MDEQEIYDLIDDADYLGYGSAQVAQLERAVEEADLLQKGALQFYARKALVTSATYSGATEKAIVAFAWCVAKSDSDPERHPFDSHPNNLLWSYKVMNEMMVCFSTINSDRVECGLLDFESRYQKKGLSLRPVYSQLSKCAMMMGKENEVVKSYNTSFMDASRDGYADCVACEQDYKVQYALFSGDFSKALYLAEPLFTKLRTCAEVPHITYPKMLFPALFNHRHDLAELYALKSEGLCLNNSNFLNEAGLLIQYYAFTNRLDDARRIFQLTYKWVLNTNVDRDRLSFFKGAHLLFERLDDKEVKLSIPSLSPVFKDSGSYQTHKLRLYFEAKSTQLMNAFDERNANHFVSDSWGGIREKAKDYDLA